MVFFANLIVLAVTIPSYLYVYSLVPNPAKFQVTDLVFDQSWVQVGTPVEISVNVTNIGDESGNHSVTLTIDDVPVATKTVQLSGAETTTLFFNAEDLTVGNHTVAIGDLAGSIRVTSEAPIRPAELQLTNLGVSRTVAGIGETITVSATATNIGNLTGEFSLDLFVNDEKRETKIIQLDSGETTTVEFEVVEDAEGDYVVTLRDLTTSFSVTSDAPPVKPAEFQITELTVNPPSVMVDEIVKISVKVTNVGEAGGSYTVNLKIDGTIIETRAVTLSGGATGFVEFEVTATYPGTHTLR